MAANNLTRLGLVVALLGVWSVVEGRAPRKGRVRQQGVLRAEGRPQQVQPVSRARRAPEPQIEEEYLEEDYNYIDGYDDEYYADGEEYFDEYSGGPNRGDQSLVSPETTPPAAPDTTRAPSKTPDL